MASKSFGRYRLVRLLARGGMAEVYLAVLEGAAGFEKRLALKKILPTFGDLEEFTQLFKDEARISVTLNHSHIVQVFDFGIHNGEHFIAMEYVDGPDLEKVLLACRKLRHPLDIDALLYIATRVAGALEYAHSRADDRGDSLELVHRDVSPPNVLLSVQGEVKITDFGVARYAQKISKSRPGVVRGKYAYMSPEQLMGEDIDSRSDLFSLGAVLYEMLTLRSPFLGETDYQTMEAVVTAQPPNPLELRRDAPRDLIRIIRKCLRRNPDERYQSAGALRRDLAELMFNRGVIDDPMLLLEELWTLFPKQLKRRGAGSQNETPEPAASAVAVGAPRMRSGPGVQVHPPPSPDWGPARPGGPAVIGPGDARADAYDDDDDDLAMTIIGNPDAIPTQPLDGESVTIDRAAPAVAQAPDPFAATAPTGPAHGRIVAGPEPYALSAGGTDETIPIVPGGRAALDAEARRLGQSTFDAPEPLAAAPFKPTDKVERRDDLASAADLPPLDDQTSSHPNQTSDPLDESIDPHAPPAPGLVAPPTAVTTPSAALADVAQVEEPPMGTGPAAEKRTEVSPTYNALLEQASDAEVAALVDAPTEEPPEGLSPPDPDASADVTQDDEPAAVPAVDSTREFYAGTDQSVDESMTTRRLTGEAPALADRTLDDDLDGPGESSPWLLVVAALVMLGVVLFGVKMLSSPPSSERFQPSPERPLRAGEVERDADAARRAAAPTGREVAATPTPGGGAVSEAVAAEPANAEEPDAAAEPDGPAEPDAGAAADAPEAEEPKAEEPRAEEPSLSWAAPKPTPTPERVAARTPTPRPAARTATPTPKPKATPKPRATPAERQPVVAEVVREPTPEPAAAGVALQLNSSPKGAQLTVDGQKVGAAPYTVRAEPGDIVEVTARLDGYLGTTRMLRVGEGDEARTIELSPAPGADANEPGKLKITSTPWAYVTVDGRILGQVTPLTLDLPPGEHNILLENPELGWSDRATVTIEAGKTSTLERRR